MNNPGRKQFAIIGLIILPFILSAPILRAPPLPGAAQQEPALAIKVSGIAPGATGLVMAAVCADPDEFAGRKAPFRGLAAAPDGTSAVLNSGAIPPGTYAVKVYQDINGNGALDYNFLGIPREPYGFSNGADGRPGSKTWRQASFVVASNGTTAVNIRLK